MPMPSRTVKERTTNVNVAGKRNGLSAEASSRSSPIVERICLRFCFFSSLVASCLKPER